MRNLLWIILFGLFFSIFFASCGGDSRTYARQIDEERALIDNFIKRQGIVITNTMPHDSVFLAEGNENLFFRSSSGLLYRLEEPNSPPSPPDTIIRGVSVNFFYIEYTLTERSDTADFRSPQSFPFGNTFIFGGGPTMSTSTAFIEAFGYMKRSGTKARLIVPHRIGFNTGLVRPFGYDLEIKFFIHPNTPRTD